MAIEITSFRSYVKNSLQGFATIRLTNVGIEICDLTLHEKNGKRWLSMPARPYEKDGETKYALIVDFYDKALGDRLQAAALDALDRFEEKGRAGGGF